MNQISIFVQPVQGPFKLSDNFNLFELFDFGLFHNIYWRLDEIVCIWQVTFVEWYNRANNYLAKFAYLTINWSMNQILHLMNLIRISLPAHWTKYSYFDFDDNIFLSSIISINQIWCKNLSKEFFFQISALAQAIRS